MPFRLLLLSVPLMLLLLVPGCGSGDEWIDIAPGRWQRVGSCSVCVEVVRLGKVLGRHLGQPGESKEEVLMVHTLFRNDEATPVKRSPWQRDSEIIMGGGLVLKDEPGEKATRYKPVVFGMFGEVQGRQKGEAILKAGDGPVADMITFEGKAATASTLYLELPTNWFTQTSNGWVASPSGKFRFRIPRASIETKRQDWTEAGPGRWRQLGSCSVCVESVRLGKVKGSQLGRPGESKEDVLMVHTLFRNDDKTVPVKRSAWQQEAAFGFGGNPLVLRDDKGTDFKPLVFGLFGEVQGRQRGEVILKGGDAPVADMITFEGKAAAADALYLELPADWRVQQGKEWVSAPLGRFYFRIPRGLWTAPPAKDK
jgi:hypothetical protein